MSAAAARPMLENEKVKSLHRGRFGDCVPTRASVEAIGDAGCGPGAAERILIMQSLPTMAQPSDEAPPVRSTRQLLADGERAVWDRGDLCRGRELFDLAFRRAQRARDPRATAAAALGLAGLWVHEHQSFTSAAVALDRLRRAAEAATCARDETLAARLRARLTAETDYRSAEHGAIRAVVEQARHSGDPIVLAEALNLAHQCLMAPNCGGIRRRLADELITTSTRTRRRGDLLLGRLWRTVDLVLDSGPQARRSLAELRRTLAARDHLAVDHGARAIEVMFEIRAGRFDQAERRAGECADAGRAAGQPAAATAWHAAQLVTVRWYQGRITEVLPLVRRVAESASLSPVDYSFQALLALAAAAAGDQRQARTALAALTGDGRSLAELPRSGSWLVALYAIVEAAHLLGDWEAADQAYRLLRPFAHLPIAAGLAVSCFGSVEHALGLAQLTLGEYERAAEHLRRAVYHNNALGHWPAAALAQQRLVAALKRRATGQSPASPTSPAPPVCRRQGRDWRVQAAGRTVEVEHCRGMAHLAVLFANPGREISALELATIPRAGLRTAASSTSAATTSASPTSVSHDDAAHGLTDWVRALPSSEERARIAVGKAIRRALQRIADADPELGRLLADGVRTGKQCAYTPTEPCATGAPLSERRAG